MKQKNKIGQKSDKKMKPASPPIFGGDDFVSATQAADELGLSDREVRRRCATGELPASRTQGGHYRLKRGDLDVLLQQSKPSAMAPSRLDGRREDLQSLGFELQEKKLRRDLRRLDEEDAEAERKRAAEAIAEESRHAAALEEARQQRLERERQRIEQQQQREAEEERQQWIDSWTEHGMNRLPPDLPYQFRLHIPGAIEEALQGVGPTRSRAIVEQVVLGAIQRAIEPWERQQEIEKAVRQATRELPSEVRTFGDFFLPTVWENRAMTSARQAIAYLAPNASFAELRAGAVNAGKRVGSEYLSEQAREQTRQRNASNKILLVAVGVAEVGSYLWTLHREEEIFDEDLAKKNQLEQAARIALEQRLTGGELPKEAVCIAHEVVDSELNT